MRSRRLPPLLSALLAALISGTAGAGDVTVSEVDPNTGSLKELVAGKLDHSPRFAYQFHSNDAVRLADVCGAVYEVRADMYGEKSFSEPLHPDRSLAQVRHVVIQDRSAEGIGHDGKPWALDLGQNDFANRKGDFYESVSFASPYTTAVDLSRMRFYVAGDHGIPDLAFLDDGGLLGIHEIRAGDERLRFIEPRKGWGNIEHAVITQVGRGRERHAVLITLDSSGQLSLNTPVEVEDGGWNTRIASFQAKAVGTGFGNTRAMFAHPHEDAVLRWTKQGSLYRVDLATGKEQLLGKQGAFGNGNVSMAGETMYYIEQNGRFADCPVEEEVVVAEEPKDMSIVKAADDINALADANYEAIDALGREHVPSFPSEFSEAEAQINQLLEKVTQTESTVVKPVRDKIGALYSQYGDQYDINAKIRDLTDQRDYLNSKVDWTWRAIQKWDEYRFGIAEALAQNGRIYYILAEEALSSANRKGNASKHYLAAKPWLEAALKFNPDHAEAKEKLAKADANASAGDAAAAEAIAKAIWPNDARVKGDIKALKTAMLKYFQERDSGEYHDKGARYFAIRIDHDWYVSKTNILDQPTEWRVSAYVASTVPGDPKHARVHWMEAGVTTRAGDLDFDRSWGSSESYLIPIERVPADDPAMLKESLKLIGR